MGHGGRGSGRRRLASRSLASRSSSRACRAAVAPRSTTASSPTFATRPVPPRCSHDRHHLAGRSASASCSRPTWPGSEPGWGPRSAVRRRSCADSCGQGSRRTSSGSAPSRSCPGLRAPLVGLLFTAVVAVAQRPVPGAGPRRRWWSSASLGGIAGRDYLPQPGGGPARGAHADRVPHGGRAARAGGECGRGCGRRARTRLPPLARGAVRRAAPVPGRRPRRSQPAHGAAGTGRPHRPDEPDPLRRRHRRRRRAGHPSRRGAPRPGAGRPRGRPTHAHGGRAARRRST